MNYSIEKNDQKTKAQVKNDAAGNQADGGLQIDEAKVKKIKVEKAFANHADTSAANGGTGADDDEAKRLEEAMREADRIE